MVFGNKNWLLDINKSAIYSIDKHRLFESKRSNQNLSKSKAMVSPNRTKREQSQTTKVTPKAIMNYKSKEILYKTYLNDLKLCTEKYSKIVNKDDIYNILVKMKYINSSSIMSNKNVESYNKCVQFLLNQSKEILSNLCILLFWIESFYELYK